MKKSFCIAVILFAVFLNADTFMKVKSIEFKGLNVLSKYEIVHKAGIIIKGGSIVIDKKKLSSVLDNEKVISDYSLKNSDGKYMIIISEKKKIYNILIKKSTGNRLYIIDDDFKPLAVDKMAYGEPLIVIDEKFIKNDDFSKKLIAKLELLSIIRTKFDIYSEIDEVQILEDSYIVRCHSRKTIFFVGEKISDFYKLTNTVGYLDRIGYYPEKVDLKAEMTVIK